MSADTVSLRAAYVMEANEAYDKTTSRLDSLSEAAEITAEDMSVKDGTGLISNEVLDYYFVNGVTAYYRLAVARLHLNAERGLFMLEYNRRQTPDARISWQDTTFMAQLIAGFDTEVHETTVIKGIQ